MCCEYCHQRVRAEMEREGFLSNDLVRLRGAFLSDQPKTLQVNASPPIHLGPREFTVEPRRYRISTAYQNLRAWLNEWMNQAQRLWRMVRFRMTRTNQAAGCDSEINLSGVPPALARNLTLTGLESLRWAVSCLVETAQYLADASLSSEALDPANCSKPEPQTNTP